MRTLVCCAVLLTLTSGCVGVAKFPTIEPVTYRPSGVAPQAAVEVHSLTPTFKWKPAPGVAEYDFALWLVGPDGSPGEVEYYREKIADTEHTVSKILLPGEYFWSVKPHGSTVWATASFTQVNPLFVSWGKGLPFRIKIVGK